LTIPDRTLFLSREQLKNEIISRSSSQGMIIDAAKNLCLKPEILVLTYFLPHDSTWSERIYCIKNNILHQQKCDFCKNNNVNFAQNNIGYHKFCSRECSAQADSTKLERVKTNIKKYGNPIAFNNINVKLKQKNTLLERYNITNSWHLAANSGISKISQELFWNVWQNSKQKGEIHFGELNGELRLNFNGKIFKPDYAQIDGLDRKIIEFDGGYWHDDLSSSKDLKREKILKNDGWTILRIKEKDYIADKLETINKCVAFLNGDLE
jgi:hypothetical protein